MTVDTLSQVFAALADPTRRDMVARLSAGDAADPAGPGLPGRKCRWPTSLCVYETSTEGGA